MPVVERRRGDRFFHPEIDQSEVGIFADLDPPFVFEAESSRHVAAREARDLRVRHFFHAAEEWEQMLTA